jgi:formylglycine-generating enzyme
MKIHRYGLIILVCGLAVAATGSLLAFRRPAPQHPSPPSQAVADGAACCGQRMPDPEAACVADAGPVEPTTVRDADAPGPAPEGMVWVPAGRFSMGSTYSPFADARPIHPVELDGFWMDRTPVTNADFARFIRATGYVTVAEQKPDPKDFPGVPVDQLVPGSLVFDPPSHAVPLDDFRAWWNYVEGACWKHPEGPGSDLAGRENHPVVQVSWEDAAAYARWVDKRLPAEAEWEYAARGGLTQMPYVWGKEFRPGGRIMANTWQGRFPDENSKEDGWERTSPVGSYPANGFGLFDMAGNVWQWCADWYRPDAYRNSPLKNPTGPADSYDPEEPGVPKRVQRGGSFLCSDQYCSRYMPGGRGKGAADTGASHVGFRCVRSP